MLLVCATANAAELKVVTAFESAALYWKVSSDDSKVPYKVRYRATGESEWRDGYPLWFDGSNSDKIKRGGFLKTSDRMGGGRIFLFHNTLLQPPAPTGFRNALGCRIGMGHGGNMSNVISRNNIFHTSAKGGPFNDRTHDPQGDSDYDLYNGRLLISTHEQHGIAGSPSYEPIVNRLPIPLPFVVTASSLGVDAGVKLPDFNDGFTGEAPDIGAHERDSSIPAFGAE